MKVRAASLAMCPAEPKAKRHHFLASARSGMNNMVPMTTMLKIRVIRCVSSLVAGNAAPTDRLLSTLAHDPHQFFIRQPGNVGRYIGFDLLGFCPAHGASPSQGPPPVC